MTNLITVSTCNLNQWALDFKGNKERIVESILIAKKQGSKLRIGSELEVTGYGCLDHFYENDTITQSWEVLAEIIKDARLYDILIDIGMPILYENCRYNCRVIVYNGIIQGIRPKKWLANDGNYREMRYFTPWMKADNYSIKYKLPFVIEQIHNQAFVCLGNITMNCLGTKIGFETCEELFTPQSPNIDLSLNGVEIICNSSGSHHELRKLDKRLDLIINATKRCGGIYLYANQIGCDGDRLYYDGCALIVVNGEVVAQGSQFSLNEVEVITATVDLDEVRSYRSSVISRNMQAMANDNLFASIDVPFRLQEGEANSSLKPTTKKTIRYHSPEEEIALGPACWLWDYLRRCGGPSGYFIPLSGGIDSCATSMIVYSMCDLVFKAIKDGNKKVLSDLQKVSKQSLEWIPESPEQISDKLFHTCYMGTSNSSKETKDRAEALSKRIGAYHTTLNMDSIVAAMVTLFEVTTGKKPIYKIFGGSPTENLALQNIQARLRMVLSYLFAQLLPWCRNSYGGLLVLGSSNVDECLRGYLTKYDCSSADLNPIGAISKTDLKKFILYCSEHYENFSILKDFITAVPTAELEPIVEGQYTQQDEADMGVSYDELSEFGYLRKVEKLGIYSMFVKLLHKWGKTSNSLHDNLDGCIVTQLEDLDNIDVKKSVLTRGLSPREIAEKVKHFHKFYAINRHKQTTLTPAYHAENYSTDDNRFDLRPILINSKFEWGSAKIDLLVDAMEKAEKEIMKLD
ncbi:hypothetical protein QEN19_001237 [Hanseniaspora menglaensis]